MCVCVCVLEVGKLMTQITDCTDCAERSLGVGVGRAEGRCEWQKVALKGVGAGKGKGTMEKIAGYLGGESAPLWAEGWVQGQ